MYLIIKNDTFLNRNPYNVAFNTGMLILYVGSSTIASFLVAVTAPLSVPLFIKYASV